MKKGRRSGLSIQNSMAWRRLTRAAAARDSKTDQTEAEKRQRTRLRNGVAAIGDVDAEPLIGVVESGIDIRAVAGAGAAVRRRGLAPQERFDIAGDVADADALGRISPKKKMSLSTLPDLLSGSVKPKSPVARCRFKTVSAGPESRCAVPPTNAPAVIVFVAPATFSQRDKVKGSAVPLISAPQSQTTGAPRSKTCADPGTNGSPTGFQL